MVKLIWTDQALEDVDNIAAFISKDSYSYAKLFTSKIFKSAEKLLVFPKTGQIVPEINKDNIREIILGNYRIIYRLTSEKIHILTVYHTSRIFNI